jgi:mannose-6-phosphate isomerase-like protein (cupin superfamily)
VFGDLADDVRVAGRGTEASLRGQRTAGRYVHHGRAGNSLAPEPTVWSHAHLIRPGQEEHPVQTAKFIPDWRELVRFAAPRPEPTLIRDEAGFRVLLAGLEPGGAIPVHPERLAIYHILEGHGSMVVDEERFALAAGATVIAPRGSRRGIEAATRLAFLAVRVGPELDEAG